MSTVEISLTMTSDFDAIGELWRELEARSDASFFQSWAWTGCLATERFSNPILLTARTKDRVLALGLFNGFRSTSVLWLGEHGDSKYDDIFIEHNGFLVERERLDLIPSCLERARTGLIEDHNKVKRNRLLRLSGVPAEYMLAARVGDAPLQIRAMHDAPFIDLEGLRRLNQTALASLSRNTRYQIRRSERGYAQVGPLLIERARSEQEGHEFLTALAQLHQAYWTRRGQRGAFANPQFERFHRTLIDRTFATGGTDLLRVTAGTKVIGYLYNFSFQGRIFAYQSGFDYEASNPHCKPGLTCHYLAINMYLSEGAKVYDFLAGADRYKLSFATNTTQLYWLEYGEQPIWQMLRNKLGSAKHWLAPP